MFQFRVLFLVGVSLLMGLAAGCGKKTFKLVPVKGKVTVDGKPMGNLMLQFMPYGEDKSNPPEGPTSTAVSDDQGNFELKTSDGQPGAVPGRHVVIVVDQLEERPPQGEEPKNQPRLNPVFSTAAGGVKVTVEEGKDVTVQMNNQWNQSQIK